jgi:hypothetical protein
MSAWRRMRLMANINSDELSGIVNRLAHHDKKSEISSPENSGLFTILFIV